MFTQVASVMSRYTVPDRGFSPQSSPTVRPMPQDCRDWTAGAVGVQDIDPPSYSRDPMEQYDKWWAESVAYNESKRGTDEWLPYYRSTPSPTPQQSPTSQREARRKQRDDLYDHDASVAFHAANDAMKASWYDCNSTTLEDLHQKQLNHLHAMSDKNISIKPYKPARQFLRRKAGEEKLCPEKKPITPPSRRQKNVPPVITPEYLLSRFPPTPPEVFSRDVKPKSPTAHLPTPQYAPRPPLSLSDIATAWIPTFKTRRANRLFSKAFSFSAPSQRSEGDWTSEISPRTSVSCNAGAKEQAKRQRVDSSSAGVGECKKKKEKMSERRISTPKTEPSMVPKSPTTRHAAMMTTRRDEDMHPGRRVSFTRRSDPVLEEYHAFLADDCSSAIGCSTSIEEVREQHKDCGHVSQNKDCQSVRTARTSRERAPTVSSTRETASEVGSSKSVRSASGGGERCSSTEAVLKAIRESFEKRSAEKEKGAVVKEKESTLGRKDRKASYGIFADEDVKGFLGNEKL